MNFLMRKPVTAIITILAVALIFATVFSCTDIALAADVDRVFPVDGYIQAERVDVIGANEDYVLSYDGENHVFAVTGASYGTIPFDKDVLKIFVFGDKAVVKTTSGHAVLDLTTFTATDTALFDECYLATDGAILYSHSWGKVDVYDDTLTITATYDDDTFKNKPVMVTDGETIFNFAVDYGVNKLYTYHIDTDFADTTDSIFVENALMGDMIFAHDGERIILIDKTTFAVTETDLEDKNFAVCGSTLYVAKGEDGYDVYALENGTLTFTRNHSFGGDGLTKLNTPTDVTELGGNMVIADKGNNRILFVSDTVVSLGVASPEILTASDTRLYVVSEGKLLVIEDMTVKNEIIVTEKIVDMVYRDRLYVLTENGVYTLISGALIKVFDVTGGIAFDVDTHFYVLKEGSVSVISMGGKVNNLLSFDLDPTPQDILVDKVGNVFVLDDNNTVHRYDWAKVIEKNTTENTVTFDTESLDFAGFTYTAINMNLIGDKLVFVTEENALISIDNILTTTTPARPDIDLDGKTADVYTASDNTYILTNNLDGKTALEIEANVDFVAYEVDGLLYGKVDGVEGWIYNTTPSTSATAISGEYEAKEALVLYVNPDFDSNVIVNAGTRFDGVDDASGYGDGKWMRVNYNGKTYFVESARVKKVVSVTPTPPPPVNDPIEPEEVKVDYGRAKASRAGELVPLFSAETGEMIAAVKDGTKLEIVEKVGDYYKVKYEGTELLIHQDDFKLDGLTTVQIIAIVLSIVVVLAGGLVFMVTNITKKKEDTK